MQATLFRGSPQFAYGWRRAAAYGPSGARVGERVLVRPTGEPVSPLFLDNFGRGYAWIEDDVVNPTRWARFFHRPPQRVVSQRSYLCAGDTTPHRSASTSRARAYVHID